MFKRVLSIILISVMVLALVAGCGSQGVSKAQKDAVEKGGKLVGICPDGTADYVKRGIEAFKKKYPNWDVEVTFAADFEQKIRIALGAKEGLDIMWSGGSDYPQIWGEQEALVPLDPFLKEENINIYDVYEKPYVDELKYKDQQLLLPTDCFTYGLWFNKLIFDKAGVPYPEKNKSYSWEELLDVGKKLTMDTDGDGKTDVWAISLLLPTWHIVQPWYYSTGARILSNDGKKASGYIDSPEFIEFVTKYRDLMYKYKIALPLNIPETGDSWAEAWTNGFLAGKAAMHVSAPWMIPEANTQEKNHPELLKWGTALPPRLAGDKPYSVGGTAGWGIAATCPDEKRLMAFRAIWEISAGAGAEWWYEQNKMYTTKTGMKKFLDSEPDKYGGWVEAINYLVPMEQIGKMAWKSAVEPKLTSIISKAVLSKMEPEEACKQAAKEIDAEIAKYEASN